MFTQTILDKIKTSIVEYNMLQQGNKIVVGVSGGPDSVALLHILQNLSKEYNLTLWVAHLNHLLRQDEADEDALFVKRLSDKFGLECIIERIAVAKTKRPCCSIEQEARHIRYEFLCKTANKVGATKIALGHQADDNIETILMWLLRGCGPQGFKGIPPIRQINSKYQIIRPLIKITPSEIYNYLKEHNLEFRIDSSNLKKDYIRNKIRLELLPELAEYNPQIRESLKKLSSLWQMDDDCLINIAQKAKQEVMQGIGRINITILTTYHKAIQSRILKMAIEEIKGDLKGVSHQQIKAILDLITSQCPQKRLDLTDGIRIERIYQQLIIKKSDFSFAKERFEYLVNVPGETRIKQWVIKTQIKEWGLKFGVWDPAVKGNNTTACLDYNKLSLPLMIRNRMQGDRFQPYGLIGTKKIKDFFIDLKIPLSQRDVIPLIVDKEKIVWVVGYRIDDRVKITDNTKNIVKIKIKGENRYE